MNHWLTIRRTMAALAWLGLALGPMVNPTITMAAPMEMAAVSTESAPVEMAEGMPCCPDQPAKPDCAKNCPFMAVCSGTAFPTTSGAATPLAPIALLAVIAPTNDAKLSSLSQGPPPRPPKA